MLPGSDALLVRRGSTPAAIATPLTKPPPVQMYCPQAAAPVIGSPLRAAMETAGNKADEPTPTTWGRALCPKAAPTESRAVARQSDPAKIFDFFIQSSP